MWTDPIVALLMGVVTVGLGLTRRPTILDDQAQLVPLLALVVALAAGAMG